MIVWIAALGANAMAGTIVTDRPSVATSARTVGQGAVQVETGAQLDTGPFDMLTLPTLVRYGLSDRNEIRFTTNVLGVADTIYVPTVGVEWKFNVVEDADTAVGVLVGTSMLPATGALTSYAAGLVDLTLGPVGAWTNVGLSTTSVTGQFLVVGTYSLGASMVLKGAYSAHLEYSGVVVGGLSGGGLQLGLTWAKDNLAFDGFVQPAFPGLNALTLGAGVSYRWGR